MDVRVQCATEWKVLDDSEPVTIEEGYAKIQLPIVPHEDLLIIVKRRKLHLYGHVSRSSERVIVC